jgi:hypothetical protein
VVVTVTGRKAQAPQTAAVASGAEHLWQARASNRALSAMQAWHKIGPYLWQWTQLVG